MRKIVISAALSLVCTSAMATQLYRWVDENGVTQFSQQPPAEDQYQRLQVKPAPELGTGSLAPAPDASAEEQTEATEPAAAPQPTPEQQAKLAEQCDALRANLTTMQNNPRLRRTLEDGTVERIGEDERQAMIAKAQADLQEHCQ
ncbi:MULTISPECIES: DUF4124 domain-containing protein [Pseudomonas]|uniref:DUF4124 domain-containing protein n=1 Tax=Pseudomonas abyssi TaxID=170540 RepID=A0A395QZ30_9PSED|nr:DUF4124 domain-containing protein [Halopseudomonas gallaeciensis]MAG64302.1 hypothetical protein [Pseudomonadales bacterium]RGP53130.1 hypothetical protein ASB58_16230 [Halopseudomonas gallaeciensis]|tara:strand:+ start:1689 stop:2123 length:435 start_codon:yes stop_codon:yes gene_type:complete